MLLPVAAVHAAELLGHESVTEMLAQHTRIRGLAMRLRDELDRREAERHTLGELGDLLEAHHIRLEERVVFPLIEDTLSGGALSEVARRLADFESGAVGEPVATKGGLRFDPWPDPGNSEGGGWE